MEIVAMEKAKRGHIKTPPSLNISKREKETVPLSM
jgi:hypothetical protein